MGIAPHIPGSIGDETKFDRSRFQCNYWTTGLGSNADYRTRFQCDYRSRFQCDYETQNQRPNGAFTVRPRSFAPRADVGPGQGFSPLAWQSLGHRGVS